jgi:hypothetical protein
MVDNVMVLQNLEPAFAETFNRQGQTFSNRMKYILYSDLKVEIVPGH